MVASPYIQAIPRLREDANTEAGWASAETNEVLKLNESIIIMREGVSLAVSSEEICKLIITVSSPCQTWESAYTVYIMTEIM